MKSKGKTKMKKTIRSLFITALALAAMFVTGAAVAASVPTVIWDGDFDATKLSKVGTDGRTYTLNLNGNTIENGELKITSTTQGATIDYGSKSGVSDVTVLIRYRDLAQSTSLRTLMSVRVNTSNIQDDGVSIPANSMTISGAWADYRAATFGTAIAIPEAGCASFCFPSGADAYGGAGSTANAMTALACSGLKFTSADTQSGIAVGGPRVTGKYTSACKDLIIEAVAIFNGSKINASGFSDFKWPTKWIGGEGNWSDAADWSDGVPVANQVAIIPAGAVVDVDANATPNSVSVQGEGTIVVHHSGNFDNANVPSDIKLPTGLNLATWKGTLWIKATNMGTGSNSGWNLSNYGNAASTVRFSGVHGYLAPTPSTFNGTLDLDNDGGSFAFRMFSGSSGSYANVAKLTGAGKIDATGSVTMGYGFGDVSGFTGSINSGTFSVHLGEMLSNKDQNKRIVVAVDSVANIGNGATWTSGAGGIIINGTVNNAGSLASSVSGGGTVIYEGKLPTTTEANSYKASTWTGTVWLKNKNTDGEIQFGNYGNASSFIKVTDFCGYLPKDGSVSATVELDGESSSYALKLKNGFSSNFFTFAKLTGSGKLVDDNTATQRIQITDGTEFAGDIDMQKGKQVVFGATTGNDAKRIVIMSDNVAKVANGKTWTATNGIFVNGTLICNGALSGATTFNTGSTLDLSGRTAATALVTGNLTLADDMTIKLPANAASPYALATGTITATAGDRVLTIGDWTGIAKVSFANGAMTFAKIGNGTEDDPYVVSTEADLNAYAAKAPTDGSEITYVKVVTTGFFFTLNNSFNVPTAHPVSLIVDATLAFVGDYTIVVPTGATLYLSSPNGSSIPGVRNAGTLYANNVMLLAGDYSSSGTSLYTATGGRSEIYGGLIEDKKVVEAGATIALGGNVSFGDAAGANTINLADGTTQVVAKDSNNVAYAGPNLKLVYVAELGQGQTLVSGILSETVKNKFSFFEGEVEVTDKLNYNAEAGTITTSTLNAQVVRNGGDPEMFEDLPDALSNLAATDTGVTITLLSDYEDSETALSAACDVAIVSGYAFTAKFDLANGKAISYPASATITFVQDAANYRVVTKDGVTSVKLNGVTSYTWTGAIDDVWAKDGNWSPTVGYPGLYTGDSANFPALAAESVITLPDGGTTIATLTGAFKIDISSLTKPTISTPVTLITGNASGATVTLVTAIEGYYLKTDATGLTYRSNTDFLRYGYAFEDNVNKESDASESITIGDVSTYESGVRTRALAFRNGKNYGTGFGFGGGDFTIFAVIKAPTDANRCIFALGGQQGTDGLLGLRTAGANSVAVFTKGVADLITTSVEDSATMYHYYALKYDSTAHTIALSVDGGEFGTPVAYTSGTGNQFQFGGIHGGAPTSAANANNGAIDEFQLYTAKLAVEQIQSLGAAFEPNTWVGANGGAWATASNWSYNEVPAAGAAVIIPTGDTAEAYKIVLASDATVSLGSATITGSATSFEFENGEVTLSALKSSVDIQVGADDMIIFPNRKDSIVLANNKVIKGSGRVVMVGHGITGTSDLLDTAAFPGCKDQNNWTGTLEVRDWHGEADANHSKFGDDLGNINSVVALNGFKGYVYAKDFAQIKAYEIGENGVEFVGQFSAGNIGFIGDLIGSGDLKLSLTGNTAKNGYLRFVGDSSAYTGSFSFAANNAFPISLIPSTSTTMPLAEFSQRMIILAVEAGAWTVNGDVEVIAGASFDTTKRPTINGKIKFDSDIVVKTTEGPSEEGVLFINDTQLTPGTISALSVTVKVGDEVQEGSYHPVTTEAGVVAKIVDVVEWGDGTVEFGESKNIGAALVVGDCTVKGTANEVKLTLGSIAINDGKSLTLDNITVEVNEINVFPQAIKLVNGARIIINDTMTMVQLAADATLEMEAGTQYSIYNVPEFKSGATLKITNASTLQPGNYLLMDWSNWPNPDSMGYGMPQLDVTGYTGAEGSIRIIPETYKLWLQVRSAEEMARPALTIEPIGDSITEGLNNASGSGKNYRIPLVNKLLLAGYNVKSVGYWNKSANNGVIGAYDPSGALITNPDWIYHSGKGSARAGAVSGGNARVRDAWANDIDVGGAPDIVLLHIGINDMLNNSDNDTDGTKTYAYITNVVTGILRDRPDVKIVMSSPMANAHGHQSQTANYEDEPGKQDKNHQFCQPCHDYCLEFYNKVKSGELLSDIDGAADRLFFADQFLAVQPSWYDDTKLYLNDGSDHCHPNWLGHDLMAETWLNEIKAAFPDPEDKAGAFHSRRTNKGTFKYGAENNIPEEYRKGFKKVRQFNTSFTGSEQMTPGTALTYDYTDDKTADSAKVTKVGYYVEYVRETSTTNIHRFVWVDMDKFANTTTVADVGIPTQGNQQCVVNKLHVYGNHPAVFNIAANNDSEKGFIEFTPYTYGDSNIPTIEGAPAHFAPYDWHDELLRTGAHGCMQVHRILNPADQLRPAQVVFAYNAFTANGGNDQNTVLGIGNFSQSFQSTSTDWTYLHQSETCNATAYSVRNIEIWVKVAPVDDSGNAYDTIEEAINDAAPDDKGITEITINTSDPMPIDLTKIEGSKSFKLKDASVGTVTWTETATKTISGKYISYNDGAMTIKEGVFPNVSFVENGLQAAALGIDVSNATDKPYLKSVQDDSPTMVKFNFYHGTDGIITPTGIGGLTVKYAVEFADSSDFLTGKSETEPTTESSVSVALPTETNKKTRYYRPKFSFGN